jgi:protein-S-isoprenylcysteine O-methyltransferase Ste14
LWLPVLLCHIAREEQMLIERFGRQYRAYMSRTWRLIVGIY